MTDDPILTESKDADKWRLFVATLIQVRKAFSGVPAREVESLIDEAVEDVRQKQVRDRDF